MINKPAVLSVFANFQFVVRFVDDVITGPNQYIRRLVHVTDTLLGGLIKGIYPTYLNLKESEPAAEAIGCHAPLRMNALDVTVISRPVPTTGGDVVMFSTTHLFDKCRQACFLGVKALTLGHVSSNVASSAHTAVTVSSLHRKLVACGTLSNFADEVAGLVIDAKKSGFNQHKVWCTVKRFVMATAAYRYGETNPMYVFALIYQAFCDKVGLPLPFGDRLVRQRFYKHYRSRRRWY
jgi:hypothetical protein